MTGTHSLGINDVDDGGELAGVLAEVDEDNAADFYKSGEGLKEREEKQVRREISTNDRCVSKS